ncbi:MAG TPA: hypothetical protein VF043_12085 [Ktedonobacteraceae bacterium]
MREQMAYRKIPARTSAQTAYRTYAGHSAGIHPEEDADSIYPTRPSTSAVRWTTTTGNQVIQQGNRRVVIHKEPPPSRRFHWMVFMGMVMFVMVLGWLLFTAAGHWWQGKQEDFKYGTPRTFQVDQYIGHGDTPDHPDHFIALNVGGMIQVIELNPLFPKYDHVYPITTVNDSTTPVLLSFEDTRHTGKLDMLVTIGESNSYTVILLNNGTQFTR